MSADAPTLDRPRALLDLVRYQPAAIVSRVLAKRAGIYARRFGRARARVSVAKDAGAARRRAARERVATRAP